MNVGVGTASVRVTVSETTANFLQMLGTEPELGRGFAVGEDVPGKTTVAVIGYGFWQQMFGGDPRAIGSTIRVNGVPLTVIGVAPRHFDFPDQTAVWTPAAYWGIPALYHMYQTIGRLKPGVGLDQAAAMYLADIDRVSAGQGNRRAESSENSPRLLRMQDRLAGPVRPASLVLMGLMVFVLLIACANLAHLLLSRTTERRQELAIRASLGEAARAHAATDHGGDCTDGHGGDRGAWSGAVDGEPGGDRAAGAVRVAAVLGVGLAGGGVRAGAGGA